MFFQHNHFIHKGKSSTNQTLCFAETLNSVLVHCEHACDPNWYSSAGYAGCKSSLDSCLGSGNAAVCNFLQFTLVSSISFLRIIFCLVISSTVHSWSIHYCWLMKQEISQTYLLKPLKSCLICLLHTKQLHTAVLDWKTYTVTDDLIWIQTPKYVESVWKNPCFIYVQWSFHLCHQYSLRLFSMILWVQDVHEGAGTPGLRVLQLPPSHQQGFVWSHRVELQETTKHRYY